MTVTGIIMECNPFHEGHAYLLKEARRRTGADYIVVALSGDYVQRGEPAVFDKYIRAEQVLRAGADLVLELPLYAACGSAEYFARGAVALLDRLGVVTDLCFGSESGDTDYIMRNARLLALAEDGFHSVEDRAVSAQDESVSAQGGTISAEDGINTSEEPCVSNEESVFRYRLYLQSGLRKGLSFPAARAAALEAAFLCESTKDSKSRTSVSKDSKSFASGSEVSISLASVPEDPKTLASVPEGSIALASVPEEDGGKGTSRPSSGSGYPASPNDLLAVEYCRALLSCGSSIRPHAIPRIDVPSATERRAKLYEERRQGSFAALNLFSGQQISQQQDLSGEKTGMDHCYPDRFWVKDVPLFPLFADDFSYQLLYALGMLKDNAQRFADISDDLAERIRKLLPRYTGFTQFRDLLKTRNLTLTRVSRSLLHLLLGIEKDRMARLQSLGMALYARPLALNRSSAPLYSMIGSCSSIPFISRLSSAGSLLTKDEMAFLEEEIRAEELYTMTLHAVFSHYTKNDTSCESRPSALRRRQVFLDRG